MPAIDNLPFKRYMYFKDGLVHERVNAEIITYRGWGGHLVKIEVVDKQIPDKPYYGPELHLTLIDETDVVILQMLLNSRHAINFLKIAPHIDVLKPITLIPQLKINEGRKDHSLLVMQDKKALKWFYTNDNPNGMPLPGRKNYTDAAGQTKEGADYAAQIQFLLNDSGSLLVNRLQKKMNPFPNHPFYEPEQYAQGLAGGYFDANKYTPVRTPGNTEPIADGIADDLPF